MDIHVQPDIVVEMNAETGALELPVKPCPRCKELEAERDRLRGALEGLISYLASQEEHEMVRAARQALREGGSDATSVRS